LIVFGFHRGSLVKLRERLRGANRKGNASTAPCATGRRWMAGNAGPGSTECANLCTRELIAKLSVTVESKPGKGQEFLFLGPFSGPEVIFH
jgi:hypothetical protein